MAGIPPWLDTSGGTLPDDGFYDGPQADIPVFTVPPGAGGKYLLSWRGTLLGGSGRTEKVTLAVDGTHQVLSVFAPHDDDTEANAQAVLDLKEGAVVSVGVTASSKDRRSVVTRLG